MSNPRAAVCCPRNYVLGLAVALCYPAAAFLTKAQSSSSPLLLRDLSICKTQIAFAYAGIIWTANRDGSNVRRLTAGGHEAKPVFSPDGSLIAFTGDYDGNRGIYVISSAGGEPRRLSYHPADLLALNWTPDGKRILFVPRKERQGQG